MLLRFGAAVTLVACISLTTSGCMREVTGNEDGYTMTPVEPDDAELAAEARDEIREQERRFEAFAQEWTCRWMPTMNRNWHDDALCTNGSESRRPYLRPRDSYITPDEIMASAQEWAARMNQGPQG